jgi:hypothetical protein
VDRAPALAVGGSASAQLHRPRRPPRIESSPSIDGVTEQPLIGLALFGPSSAVKLAMIADETGCSLLSAMCDFRMIGTNGLQAGLLECPGIFALNDPPARALPDELMKEAITASEWACRFRIHDRAPLIFGINRQ